MPKLSDREVSLIKGLFAHTAYNDQQVLSIFTHLHRDVNSREIGFVRKETNPRYKIAPVAGTDEIASFLYHYRRITESAERIGIGQVEAVDKQVYKAIDIMRTAISVFNNGILVTRSETFVVLSIIAWTYLLHARLRSLGTEPVYVEDGQTVITDGKPKLWELSRCLNHAGLGLSEGAVNNLKYLVAVRNAVEHRSTDDINQTLQPKCQACALNFLKYCRDSFGPKFDFSSDVAFAIQLQPLTLGSPNLPVGGQPTSSHIEAVNLIMEDGMSTKDYNDPEYAFRVYVAPKVTNNAKKADQAVTYAPVGSKVEMAIKHVERPKYRQAEALQKLAAAGAPMTPHRFQQIWKAHKLKDKSKGFAIELGNQWFWYDEGIDRIKEITLPP